MRKLSIVLLTLGTAWLALAATTGAFADDSTTVKTTVSKESVSGPGARLERRDRTHARSVPDRTNIVSVTWTGDPNASFRVETKRGAGSWVDRGTDGGTDTDTAEARRAAAVAAPLVSEPILVKSPDDVRLQVATGTATAVDVTAFAADEPTPTLPLSEHAAMVPGIGLVGIGAAVAAARQRRKVTAALVIVVIIGGAVGIATTARADAAAPGDVPWPAQPRIITRAELGIDESARLAVCPSGPEYARPKFAIIHHTVNGNDYSPAGAADIVRNLYAYFINTRGYCDEAYNFLVDKYGTIYEGRAGGIDKGVVGAHATNFNTGAIGVSMIGDYSGVVPPGATVNAIGNLLAWKFTIHNINPNALASTHGTFVDPVIGHRDAGAISGDTTDCPGNGGYSIIDQIRNNVRPRVAFGYPEGAIDIAQTTLTGAHVAGWAIDPDVSAPIQVHIYVDGAIAGVTTADGARPDLGAAWPGYGNNHGFDTVVPISGGPHTVCAWGISVANGANGLLACRAVQNTPVGGIDIAQRAGGPIRVAGWAIDPASTASLPVHVYVDGVGTTITTANITRTDLAQFYPGYGTAHGFDVSVPVTNGDHTVCLYAINAANTEVGVIGCRAISGATVGSVDLIRREGGPVHVQGWALDLDTTASIPVHIYVDGVGAAITTTSVARSDIASLYPGSGTAHGFDTTVALTPGAHTICAYGIGVGPSPVLGLGCGVVPGAPVGSLDAVGVVGGAVHAQGWAIDRSSGAPATVHIYVDGLGVAITSAAGSRVDVATAYTGYGAGHGFDVVLPITPTGHTVCAYAIGAAPAGNAGLGCTRI